MANEAGVGSVSRVSSPLCHTLITGQVGLWIWQDGDCQWSCKRGIGRVLETEVELELTEERL